MDWQVYPDTPISRLPRPLRYPALLVRNLLDWITRRLAPESAGEPEPGPESSGYVYEADGLATVHFSPS